MSSLSTRAEYWRSRGLRRVKRAAFSSFTSAQLILSLLSLSIIYVNWVYFCDILRCDFLAKSEQEVSTEKSYDEECLVIELQEFIHLIINFT